MTYEIKTRTNLLLIICSLLFSVSACSDFLEITPQDIIVEDKFWNEEADVENMVAGCYSAMQEQAVIDRDQYGPWAGHPLLGAADYNLTWRDPV